MYSTSLVKPKVRAACDVAAVEPLPRSNSTRWPVELDHAMVEVDLEAELEAVVRVEPRPLGVGALALSHLDRADHRMKRSARPAARCLHSAAGTRRTMRNRRGSAPRRR
jgi:hypothetical protein